MTIYLDSDFRCHLTGDGTRRAVHTDAFDGKCADYIEGYRYVPNGESWTRDDGMVFYGEMVAPAVDSQRLYTAQHQYETDEARRLSDLDVPKEGSFVATRNYAVDDFLDVYGQLYTVIYPIPKHCRIVLGQNVYKATMADYFAKLKGE